MFVLDYSFNPSLTPNREEPSEPSAEEDKKMIPQHIKGMFYLTIIFLLVCLEYRHLFPLESSIEPTLQVPEEDSQRSLCQDEWWIIESHSNSICMCGAWCSTRQLALWRLIIGVKKTNAFTEARKEKGRCWFKYQHFIIDRTGLNWGFLHVSSIMCEVAPLRWWQHVCLSRQMVWRQVDKNTDVSIWKPWLHTL